MLRDGIQPPIQRGFKSGDNSLLPSFSHIAEESLRPFRRVLCTLSEVGNATTPVAYDSAESECEDLR